MSARQDMLEKEYGERRAKYVPEKKPEGPSKPPKRDAWRWWIAGLLVLAAIGVVVWWLWR